MCCLISRVDARSAELTRYFTGDPCKRGHLSERYVTTRACIACDNEDSIVRKARKKAAITPEEIAAKLAVRAAKKQRSRERQREAARRAYYANHEVIRAKAKEWKQTNADSVARNNADYRQNRPEMFALGYVRKIQPGAVPSWLSEEHLSEMRLIYLEARRLTNLHGQRYEVDHILPLKGEMVCGLHVPWNLQILTRSENMAKSNKMAA